MSDAKRCGFERDPVCEQCHLGGLGTVTSVWFVAFWIVERWGRPNRGGREDRGREEALSLELSHGSADVLLGCSRLKLLYFGFE